MSGPGRKTLYYYEIQLLKFVILWEWEIVHWGSVSFETKQRYHTAKRKLKEKTIGGNHE